ncbi:MAG TPA: hypothetical protein VGM47_03970 [Gammaproteobacteria bacterium]
MFLVTTVLAVVEFLPAMVLATRFDSGEITPQQMMHMQLSGGQLSLQLLCLLAVLLIQAVALTRLNHLATGAAADYRSEIPRGLQAFPSLIGAFLLSVLIAIVAMLLAGAVGALVGLLGSLLLGKVGFVVLLVLVMTAMMFYVFIYLLLVQYSIVLEGYGPVQAINRSFNLVYGHWWRAFAVVMLGVLCLVAVALVLGLALSPMLTWADPTETGRSLFVKGVIQMVAGAAFAPFVLSVTYVLYHDLKLRSQEPA